MPTETSLPEATGNKELVEYGIQVERADFRIHVCFGARHAYAYRTRDGVMALRHGQQKTASQGDYVTAKGRAVPVNLIPGCKGSRIPEDIYSRWYVPPTATHSEKGQAALDVVLDMLRRKHPEKVVAEETDEVEQLAGVDVRYGKFTVQVKCDYNGGDKRHGGTGNLFLQTHECNPYGRH